MMDLEVLRQIVIKWRDANLTRITDCPGEAKVITGNLKIDAMLYHFEQDSGIELKLSPPFSKISGCNIVDEKKCSWFVLRWA